jgi:hypothetical protein
MNEINLKLGETLKVLTPVGFIEFIPFQDVAGYCIIISSSGEAIAFIY